MKHERKEPTVSEALAELAGIESSLYATGAVDTEPTALNSIKEKLTTGEISPAKAITRARALIAGRQGYH